MGHAKPDPELEKYIRKLHENGLNSLNDGKVKIIMFYGGKCPICHKQFTMFRDRLGVNFEREMDKSEKRNKEEIIDKIFFVEEKDKNGRKLTSESLAWAKAMGNDDLEIKYTPTFLDFKTHENIGVGLQPPEVISNMVRDEMLEERRAAFREKYGKKARKKLKVDGCSEVACGMKESYKIEKEKKESEENGKRNG